MRAALLLVATDILAGCVATNYVFTIGDRSVYAREQRVASERPISVQLREAPFEVAFGHPMSSITPALDKSRELANVTLNMNEIKWDTVDANAPVGSPRRVGNVELEVDGARDTFTVWEYPDSVYLEREYRRWYGYPAQFLLVASVPIDIVTVIVAVPVGLVYLLVVK